MTRQAAASAAGAVNAIWPSKKSGETFLVAWTSGPAEKSAIILQRVGGSSR